ncbi:MAG TPA: hypothetical protein VGK16_03565 [Candidatus Limnocylindrales bacterium]|jgi:hypothetical protein
MTDQNPNETTPPGGDPFTAEPGPAPDAAGDGTGAAKSREWLAQLESMINDVATQAAPVARQIAAKAAELTAVAAVKAGPFAQKAANVTSDASHKLAERAQNLATELRGDIAAATGADAPWSDSAESAADAVDPAPAATFEDATSTADDTAPGGTI